MYGLTTRQTLIFNVPYRDLESGDDGFGYVTGLYRGTVYCPSSNKWNRPALSKEVLEILVQMTDFIVAAPAFTVIGDSGNEELQEDGQLLEFGTHLTLTIQRPSKANLRIDTRNGANATLILDGEAISVYSVKDNMYIYDTTRQPGDINTSLDLLAAQFGFPRQLGFFLSKDLTASLSRAKSGYLVGESNIAGVLCDHLALRNGDLDVQVWIEKVISRFLVVL